MDDDAILAYWETAMRAGGMRPRTVSDHLYAIRATLRRTERTLLTMTRYDLIGDMGREGISAATRAHYKSLFRTFWTWLQDEGFRADCPAVRLPSVRVIKPEANPVTTDDLQLLINSGIYAKSRMYVLLYAYQGFRASEIAAVHGGQSIDWSGRRILSLNGKGGKEVWRPLHPLVWTEAQKYPRGDWWFPSPSGGHVTGKNVSAVLSQAMKRVGIIGHRPHNLRAWYATELDRAGASTAIVAAGLRHSDLQSVPRYLAVNHAEIEAAQAELPSIVVPARSARRAA